MSQPEAAFIERLKEFANLEATVESDSFFEEGINSFAGGNIDDAHSIGIDDGYTMLAREVLAQLDIEWK
jgi:hypothetical protein